MKATGSNQNEILFMRGNAISGAPIISGTNQFPNPPIIAGMTMKKTMIRPWPVTNTLNMCPLAKYCRPGFCQLKPHPDGQSTTDNPRDHREDQVKRPDVLVVG